VNTLMACAELGARLFQARRQLGVGLIKLGKLSGVSHTTISDIEKGRRMPAVDTVERLARALHVRPEWLAYGVGWVGEPVGQEPERSEAVGGQ